MVFKRRRELKIFVAILLVSFSCIYSSKIDAQNVELYNAIGLPNHIVDSLKKIANAAGEFNVVISSKQRTVQQQVEVMLDYYISCEKVTDEQRKASCGLALAKKVYDIECHGGFNAFNRTSPREENVARMTKALTKTLIELGTKRRCMNHVVVPGIETAIIAVDIKPSSIMNHAKFYDAVMNNPKVILFYYPAIEGKPVSEVVDSAFHLGFIRE